MEQASHTQGHSVHGCQSALEVPHEFRMNGDEGSTEPRQGEGLSERQKLAGAECPCRGAAQRPTVVCRPVETVSDGGRRGRRKEGVWVILH